jgi:putative ABC transport system permease protein
MQDLIRDVRYGLRLLTRDAAFTAAAVLTLALGVGANVAMLSLAEATLLRPIQVAAPDRLLAFTWSSSYPHYREFATHREVFAGVIATSGERRLSLSIDGLTELTEGAFVSANTFGVLGVRAAAGRTFVESDETGVGGAVVGVLSHDYWSARFGRDPGVIGKLIRANDRPVTIVGVAAEGFRGTTLFSTPDIYLPVTSSPAIRTGFLSNASLLDHPGFVWLNVVGRLAEGVTSEQATAAVNTIYHRINPPKPGVTPDRLTLTTLTTRALGGDNAASVRRFVLLLVGVVGLTLLIGCANLANLLLARATCRRRELSVRLALGATRGRVLRQLLCESLLLSLLGGAAGLVVAALAMPLLAAFQLPGGIEIGRLDLRIDWVALLAAVALALLTGVLFGAWPAWRASCGDASVGVRDEGRVTPSRSRVRSALVAAQIALSLVLMIGSGLFLQSLVHALREPLGFDVSGVATASVNPGLARLDAARARVFYADALERVRTVPGVQAAAWASLVPTKGVVMGELQVDGYSSGKTGTYYIAQVGPEYFQAAGTRLVRGRPFTPADDRGAPEVAIVNEAAAAAHWAGRNPIGGRIKLGDGSEWRTIVGVVENTKIRHLDDKPAPYVYFPFDQTIGGLVGSIDSAHLFVRTSDSLDAVVPLIRDRLRATDARVPVYDVGPFADHVRPLVIPQRMGVTLFGFFASLSITLATIGIYGVASYVTALRTREIGIRIALGAARRDIGRLILLQGARPVAIGLIAGLLMAALAGRLATAFLVGVRPHDPLTFATVSLLIAALALAASYVPARRAARLDPVGALRHD